MYFDIVFRVEVNVNVYEVNEILLKDTLAFDLSTRLCLNEDVNNNTLPIIGLFWISYNDFMISNIVWTTSNFILLIMTII